MSERKQFSVFRFLRPTHNIICTSPSVKICMWKGYDKHNAIGSYKLLSRMKIAHANSRLSSVKTRSVCLQSECSVYRRIGPTGIFPSLKKWLLLTFFALYAPFSSFSRYRVNSPMILGAYWLLLYRSVIYLVSGFSDWPKPLHVYSTSFINVPSLLTSTLHVINRVNLSTPCGEVIHTTLKLFLNTVAFFISLLCFFQKYLWLI